AANDENYA
nr:Chain I, ssrA [synthetic construct]1OX9_J Chain J, ssrA [synthetic construct]1OX9_K Chain K, ssrA [synthetic construct]1OX9_L Chain L, ssrA [synthetic construct]1OX9_M Chain M, ssrA [synthetic construct]1OX9_N Chain N, ssrA [synthetic construct]1OX9_O Chain O, ssrA [synthetic construct]1OX9_P Chain P, ssrA [synthetic construct]